MVIGAAMDSQWRNFHGTNEIETTLSNVNRSIRNDTTERFGRSFVVCVRQPAAMVVFFPLSTFAAVDVP